MGDLTEAILEVGDMATLSTLDKRVEAASLLSKVAFLSKGTVWCFPGL